MRVFFGVELPDTARAAADKISVRLRRRITRDAPRAAIRWVEAANLHVTLWFIGEVDDAGLERLATAARMHFRTRAFPVEFSGLGAFPSSGLPHVIWIGINSGSEALQAVHAELQSRLMTLGYEPERRAYSPHLTLGRIKDIRRSDAQSVRSAVQKPIDAFGIEVATITLFRSRLSPKGSQYEPLLRVPLA